LSIRLRTKLLILAAAIALTGCSKLPESEAAKKLGAQPKQVIDKAADDVTKSLQAGSQSQQDSEASQSESK
jgi:Sec-independent protein translocase protein TatA